MTYKIALERSILTIPRHNAVNAPVQIENGAFGMLGFDAQRLAGICQRHDVRRLRVFGSVSRGQAGPASDIDLLVDFAVPKGLFELIRLEDELQPVFGRPVDLITEAGLSPYFRAPILADAAVIFNATA